MTPFCHVAMFFISQDNIRQALVDLQEVLGGMRAEVFDSSYLPDDKFFYVTVKIYHYTTLEYVTAWVATKTKKWGIPAR